MAWRQGSFDGAHAPLAIFQGAAANALLLGGGLTRLQAMIISSDLPFTLVLLMMYWAIIRGVWAENTGSERAKTGPRGVLRA